ncbi:MAG: 1,4-dihydroxy-2-naphthoate octaprenyltransferase [Rhabdochlamydiaceae bacterium]
MIKAWFSSCRPKTLVAVFLPVLLSSVLSLDSPHFSYFIFASTLLVGLSIQIITNFANDVYDVQKGADDEYRLGPKRGLQLGLLSETQLKQAIQKLIIFSFVVSIFLMFREVWLVAPLFILSVFLAIFYTKGDHAIAYKGFGEIFVFIFFGPIVCLTTYYLQTFVVSPSVFCLGVFTGCFSTSLILINNIRDVEQDRIAGKKTVIVRFGVPKGKKLYPILLFLGLISLFWVYESIASFIILILGCLYSFFLTKKLYELKNKELNYLLSHTSAFFLFYSFLWLIIFFLKI